MWPSRCRSAAVRSPSVFFFSADSAEKNRYQFILECAQLADRLGYNAIWTPERHFHQFADLYPNPSVLSAGLATITQQVKLRAGSVVAPLHHPARIAEEWAIVDNLSVGRETFMARADRLRTMGVDEVACLIDFGIELPATLASLERIARTMWPSPRPAAPGT